MVAAWERRTTLSFLLQKLKFICMRLKLHIFYLQVLPRENACIVFSFKEYICE